MLSRSKLFYLMTIACLIFLQATSAHGANLRAQCLALFNAAPNPQIEGLRISSVSALKAKWGHLMGVLNGHIVKQRYDEAFQLIFNDIHLAIFKEVVIGYKNSTEDGIGDTAFVDHHIRFSKILKNHPFYSVVHAHELQHYADFKLRKISYSFVNTGFKTFEIHRSDADVIKSEIRAHHREFRAAQILFSREELIALEKKEKDPMIKGIINQILRANGNEVAFITDSLMHGYRDILEQAAEEAEMSSGPYLNNEIYDVLGK